MATDQREPRPQVSAVPLATLTTYAHRAISNLEAAAQTLQQERDGAVAGYDELFTQFIRFHPPGPIDNGNGNGNGHTEPDGITDPQANYLQILYRRLEASGYSDEDIPKSDQILTLTKQQAGGLIQQLKQLVA